MSDRARDHWQWDELLGKDAGPVATSVVIPHDVAPEIEDSRAEVLAALAPQLPAEQRQQVWAEALAAARHGWPSGETHAPRDRQRDPLHRAHRR